jgi:hypothetical protein
MEFKSGPGVSATSAGSQFEGPAPSVGRIEASYSFHEYQPFARNSSKVPKLRQGSRGVTFTRAASEMYENDQTSAGQVNIHTLKERDVQLATP